MFRWAPERRFRFVRFVVVFDGVVVVDGLSVNAGSVGTTVFDLQQHRGVAIEAAPVTAAFGKDTGLAVDGGVTISVLRGRRRLGARGKSWA